jgi:hypothetical protein
MATYPLTMQFGPESQVQAFPTGKWRRVGSAVKGGRYTIEATFRSQGELALMMAICGSSEPMVLALAQEFLAKLPMTMTRTEVHTVPARVQAQEAREEQQSENT